MCGAKWKTCQCPQWDEARLLARAETRVGHVPAGRVREEAVAREAEHLREHHECQHDGEWEKVRPRGRRDVEYECEICDDVHYEFIWRCVDCEITVCTRCKFNRL